MRGKLFQNGRLRIHPLHGVERTVNVGGDGDGWPPNLQALEETAERFVGRCDDAGVEGMGGGQRNTGESFGFKGRHGRLDGCRFTRYDGHLGGVFVGRNHVAFGRLEHAFYDVIRCRYAGHQPLVVDFHGTHLGPTGGRCTKGAVHVEDARRHQRCVFTQRVAGHHVRGVAKGAQGSLDGQIGREHGRLRVLGLLEFVFRFLQFLFAEGGAQHEAGERFTAQHVDHGFIGLAPNVCGGGEALNQVSRHADVLTALAGVHVDGFCFGRHGGLVGDQDALCLKETPFVGVHHRLTCEGLSLVEFRPRGGDQRQPVGCLRVKGGAGLLKSLRKTSSPRIVVKERAVKGHGPQRGTQAVQRSGRKEKDTAFNGLDLLVGHRGGKGPVKDGRGFRRSLPAVGGPASVPFRCHGRVEIGLVAFQGHVEVRATEPEGRDAGSARMGSRAGPFEGSGGNEERNVGPVHRWVGRLKIRTWRDGSVMKGHHGFQNTGHPGCRLQVPDLGLDGTNGHVARTINTGPQSGQGGQFGGVTHLRRRPVCFHQFNAGCIIAGLAVGSCDRLDLAALAGSGDPLSSPVGRAPDAAYDAENLVLVPHGIAQSLENENAGTLAHHEPVSTSIERRGVAG